MQSSSNPGFPRLKYARARTEAAIRNKTIFALQAASLGCLLLLSGPAQATQLKPEAARGFDRYVHLTEERLRMELQPGAAFLWVDGLPEPRRNDVRARLQRGDVVSERLETRDASGAIQTPGALIHHWVGTVFIPGATCTGPYVAPELRSPLD